MKTFAAAIVFSAGICFAQIILPPSMTIDGVEYSEVVYTKHDAAVLKFSHASGMASVDISKLSPEMQAALGYNAETAAAAIAARDAEKKANAQAIQARKDSAAKQWAEHSGPGDASSETEKVKLSQEISRVKVQLKAAEDEYADKIRGWEKRKVGVNAFGVEYERKNSSKIGGGSDPDSPENKARRKKIDALKQYISDCEKKLASLS